MPSVFFSKSAGRVVRLIDPSVPCATRFYGMQDKIGFEEQHAIVTRLTISQAANVQFLHTLGSSVYIYVFGDRIGQLGLSGLGFKDACIGGGGCSPKTGLEGMLLWYRKNRVTARKRPIDLTIGSIPIEGFLTTFTGDVIDAASGLMQWDMQLATLPER